MINVRFKKKELAPKVHLLVDFWVSPLSFVNVFNHLWHLSGVVCSVSFCLSWHGKQYNVSVSRLTTPFKNPMQTMDRLAALRAKANKLFQPPFLLSWGLNMFTFGL
ncbi:hypothetical protein DI43_02350 [Geobacillus sp. CAMR12739]|nr:hypothetical protein DI43_02350 [Geobacillus sp. CAMR12739]